MAKAATQYVCQSCGAVTPRWSGKCDSCGAWNTIIEEARADTQPKGLTGKAGRKLELVDMDRASADEAVRRKSGIAEFDQVTGGGLVRGSALLIGGDPGIGKSTLLLQVCAAMGKDGKQGAALRTAYISGEEAVAQVRSSASELIRVAKRRGFTLLLVGHVTKEGLIAGPRVLEHMVDTVLYFEGDRGHQFRILRAVKNRFGPTDEIGVFEMTDGGLQEVANPSALFLAERRGNVSGSAVFAGIEGTRPVLVEIQALVSPSALATPRRAVVGWDSGRLSMVIAVLEARCGLSFAGHDVYLNVAGGLRIAEPAADLAVAGALVSALSNLPLPADLVSFGEVGLGGEVRAVGQRDQRLKEAAKLGFSRALLPPRRKKGDAANDSLELK